MVLAWRVGSRSSAALAALAAALGAPVYAETGLPEYRPLPGVSAEPRAPDAPPAEWPSLADGCMFQRGRNLGLLQRPAFAEGLGDASDLAALIDDAMCTQLREAYVAGAAVAVVDGDRIVFSSGYGYADVADETPVDPAATLFRIGSISKLFAWTSLLQLVQRGTVDLAADVNDYLGSEITIRATYPRPVTPKHLMTHTTGFEENIAGIGMAYRLEDLPTLAETVTRHVPARVRPPADDFTQGEDAAYSNWGAALAGYLVEQQSGVAFDDYVDTHIFQPLGMRHSTFREPLPAPLADRLATGHRPDEGFPPCAFQYLHGLAPGSSASVSAEDMARFARALVQPGGAGNAQILEPQTLALLLRRALSPHPHLAGGTYGFNERYVNGRRLLWHAGLTDCYYAELYLFPEEEIGLFVAYNTPPMASQMGQLAQRFMDHYFPAHLPALEPAKADVARLTPYAGYYRNTTRAHTTWEKIFDLTAAIEVKVADHGAVIAPRTPGTNDFVEWIPVSHHSNVLRRADGEDTIALVERDGNTYLLGPWPFAPMVKLRGWEEPKTNGVLLGVLALAFFLAIPTWIWAAPRHRTLARLMALAGVVNLGILLALWLAWRNPGNIMVGIPPPIYLAMGLSLASVLLATALAWTLLRAWRRRDERFYPRAALTLLALADVAFVAWMGYWNLIGFQLG